FTHSASGSRRIVSFWSLDAAANERLDATSLKSAEQSGPLAMLHLVKALRAQNAIARMWFVTRGATSIGASKESVQVAQAPLLGFVKVLGLEHPELLGAQIDFDPVGNEHELSMLLDEIVGRGEETQLAFRGVRR